MLAPPPLMACTIITRTRTSALLARGRFFGELPDELVTHIIHQLHGYALLAAATCHRTRAIVDSMLSGLPFENENDTSAERRARASPMIKLRVTVPPNSMGGDHVRLMTPVGLQMVQIPAGLQPGELFDVVCHPSNVLKGSDGVPHYMIRRYDPFRTWDLSILCSRSGGPAPLHLQRRGPRRLVSQGTNDPLFLRCTCEVGVGAHPLLMPQGCSFLRARPRLVPGACLLYNLRISAAEGGETKIELPGGVILRSSATTDYDSTGTEWSYQMFNVPGEPAGFKFMAPSNVRTGDSWHRFAQIVNENGDIETYEDGRYCFTAPDKEGLAKAGEWRTDRLQIKFDIFQLDRIDGVNLQVDLKGVQLYRPAQVDGPQGDQRSEESGDDQEEEEAEEKQAEEEDEEEE